MRWCPSPPPRTAGRSSATALATWAELLKALASFRHAHGTRSSSSRSGPWTSWTSPSGSGRGSIRWKRPRSSHLVDPATRAAYLQNLARYREELRRGCHRQRIDLVPMTTDRPTPRPWPFSFRSG